MTTFRVWAPAAQRVEMEVGGERIPLTAERGWLVVCRRPRRRAGERLCLHPQRWRAAARPPFPVAAVWRPRPLPGGRSPGVPLAGRRWQAGPLSAAVIYELHIGTFTPAGTFEAAIERLDHLVDLGITHVELMPVQRVLGEPGVGL